MALVVGIHGIGRQFDVGPQLRGPWAEALEGALVTTELENVAALRARLQGNVEVVTYGDLFRPKGTWPRDFDISDLTSPDERKLVETFYEAAVAEEPELAPGPEDLAGWPPAVQSMALRLLRAKAFADFAERNAGFFAADVKQALAYMTQDGLREQIHKRVDIEVTDETRVLIGHSMGSLIAYQYLAEGRAPQVELLVTLGSPLGIPNVIFHRLRPAPVDGRGAWPATTKRWVNIADKGDIVALEKELAPLFGTNPDSGAAVEDMTVVNGQAQHDAIRYLNTIQMGFALARQLS